TIKETPATFKKSGKTDGKKCSVCGKVLVAQKAIAKLGAPALSKVTAGSKQFKASWKSVKSIDGYQIQYSTSSSFKSGNKTVTVKGYKSTSKTVKSLKAKKKYYVRIRAYKTINGKKQYSSWSKSKTVTTKK
ncbi:MAG: fibronectin type III domain-containing protein, partial [Eubacterium sp.]|nr:fibronectin type III domain-containing protein [Eubacterium sp.]